MSTADGARRARRSRDDRRVLAAACRRLGFKRTDPQRDPLLYELSRGVIHLSVQLWIGGGHRVSFMLDGHGFVHPTEFRNEDELRRAVEHQFAAADLAMRGEADMRYRALLASSHCREVRDRDDDYYARVVGGNARNAWDDCVEPTRRKLDGKDPVFDAALAALRENPDQPWLALGNRLVREVPR